MNNKPYLFIVTGRPGAGKTTFSKKLSSEIFMPVISRDEIKEGYVHTFGKSHAELPEETNKIVNDIFQSTLKGLIDGNVSVIAEAAFQHKIWSYLLEPFMEMARLYLLICKIDDRVALNRFVERGLNNPLREYFHRDKGVDMARKGVELEVRPYEEPRFNVPTLYIDTTADYSQSIQEIKEIVFDDSFKSALAPQ